MWSVTNFRHPQWSVGSSFSSITEPFIGMSFRNAIVISWIQSHNTLLLVFIIWAAEFVAPYRSLHIRTNPMGVLIVVISWLSAATGIGHIRSTCLRYNILLAQQMLQRTHLLPVRLPNSGLWLCSPVSCFTTPDTYVSAGGNREGYGPGKRVVNY